MYRYPVLYRTFAVHASRRADVTRVIDMSLFSLLIWKSTQDASEL